MLLVTSIIIAHKLTIDQVIADLYEKYVELIGEPNEDGETMSDGYVTSNERTRRRLQAMICGLSSGSRSLRGYSPVMRWISLVLTGTAVGA